MALLGSGSELPQAAFPPDEVHSEAGCTGQIRQRHGGCSALEGICYVGEHMDREDAVHPEACHDHLLGGRLEETHSPRMGLTV